MNGPTLLTTEPLPTALLLATFGVLLVLSVLFSRATEKFTVPVLLIFLCIGMLAGSDGIGGIAFDDYALAYRLGTIALVFILFDGGLNTPIAAMRNYAAPAGVLATVGVIGTAVLLALGAHVVGFEWQTAALLGAVVSSTDAAAVFAMLRGSGLHLKRRVGATLELESGLNDPMAVILTTVLTVNALSPGGTNWWGVALTVIVQILLGVAFGVGVGFGGRLLLRRVRLSSGGLYAVLLLATALLAFGLPTLANGSGFLSVYIAGMILGHGQLPFRAGLLRVHDALAWLSQITMFLILGLLVFPSRLLEAAWAGLFAAIFLAFIARPLVVALLLAPFRYPARDVVYVSWVGLRGAVPIVLATFPVLAGAPGGERIFDVVFFIVVVGALVPGATVPWVTRKLGLETAEPPPPQAVLEIESMQPLRGELLSFYVDDLLPVAGVPVRDLPFPEGAAATMIVRGQELIAPKGDTILIPGDHVYVFARPEDLPLVHLLFGRAESR